MIHDDTAPEYVVRYALTPDWPAITSINHACDFDIPGVDYRAWTGVMLVAEHPEDGIVGFVQCLPGAPDCVVTACAVLPGHRKRGVAHQLAAGLEYVLRGLGYQSWVCYVRGGREDGWRETLTKWGAEESSIGGFFYRRMLPA